MLELEKRGVLRPYEAVILVHPDTNEEDQKNLMRKNAATIKSFKGEINHIDTWGKRSLANEIHMNGKRHTKAHYFHVTFSASPAAIAELERTMRISDHVLRFMHTRLDEKVALPQVVENFKKALAESAAREREREAKFQARRAAKSAGRGRDRGGDFGDMEMEE